jgi:CheY-like chemotaxis protein
VNQKLVLAILRKKGYRIEVANPGREAIEKIESAEIPCDAVLMDVQCQFSAAWKQPAIRAGTHAGQRFRLSR